MLDITTGVQIKSNQIKSRFIYCQGSSVGPLLVIVYTILYLLYCTILCYVITLYCGIYSLPFCFIESILIINSE